MAPSRSNKVKNTPLYIDANRARLFILTHFFMHYSIITTHNLRPTAHYSLFKLSLLTTNYYYSQYSLLSTHHSLYNCKIYFYTIEENTHSLRTFAVWFVSRCAKIQENGHNMAEFSKLFLFLTDFFNSQTKK
jgi:hypothetical protein